MLTVYLISASILIADILINHAFIIQFLREKHPSATDNILNIVLLLWTFIPILNTVFALFLIYKYLKQWN